MNKSAYGRISVCAAILVIGSLGCANASTTGAGSSLGPDITGFRAMFGIPVAQSSTPLPAAEVDSTAPTVRLRTIQRIAASNGLTWEKVYHVSPASAEYPVTTLGSAMQMVDQRGSVSLSVRGLPAYDAIRTVVAADNASVDFSDALRMGSIDASLSGDSVPEAIAALAKRTHTHWWAEYVLAPVAHQTFEPGATMAARPRMNQQQYESSQLFNGPITVHVAPPAPVTASTVQAAAAKGAADQASKDVAAATAAAKSAPSPNPYYPYGYYNPTPQPYQLSPGMTVQPGNPWGSSSIVFGGTSTTSF